MNSDNKVCLPKSRVWCPDCGKPKILFETERKANDFIKWNGDNMPHGDELRAYYCPSCCGWHVSHKKYWHGFDSKTDDLIDAYGRTNKRNDKLDKLIRGEMFDKRDRYLWQQAEAVYEDVPELIKEDGRKKVLKKYLDAYFVGKGITDVDGRLRGMVYKIFDKDIYRRAHQDENNQGES